MPIFLGIIDMAFPAHAKLYTHPLIDYVMSWCWWVEHRVNRCWCGVRWFGGTSWTSTPTDWVDKNEWTTWRRRRGSTTSWRASGRAGSTTTTWNSSVATSWRTSWGQTGLILTMPARKTVHIWRPSRTCSPPLPSHIPRFVEMFDSLWSPLLKCPYVSMMQMFAKSSLARGGDLLTAQRNKIVTIITRYM